MVLNFCYDLRLALFFGEKHSQFFNVALLAHETERNEIGAEFRAQRNIGHILWRERRKTDTNAGQIDVTSRGKHGAGQDLAKHAVSALCQHRQFDQAIINQNSVADCHVPGKPLIIHVHRIMLLGFRAANGELDKVARLEMQVGFQIASANSWALRIEQQRNRSARCLRQRADTRHNVADPLMSGVAHVQPENIRAFLN